VIGVAHHKRTILHERLSHRGSNAEKLDCSLWLGAFV
jgi:hypothetical protein